jgi:hypothetical protein
MVGNVENRPSLIGLQSFRGDERFVTRAVAHQSTVLYLCKIRIQEGFRMMQSLHTVDNRCAKEAESSGIVEGPVETPCQDQQMKII